MAIYRRQDMLQIWASFHWRPGYEFQPHGSGPDIKSLYPNAQVVRVGEKTLLQTPRRWQVTDTSLKQLTRRYGLGFKWFIPRVVKAQMRFYGPQVPFIVLDWGCGNGRTINAIGSRFLNQTQVTFMGYSDVAFQAWLWNRQYADLVHDTKEGLVEHLAGRKVGLMYGYLSWRHLQIGDLEDYLPTLSRILLPGAIVISDPLEFAENKKSSTQAVFAGHGFRPQAIGQRAFVFRYEAA